MPKPIVDREKVIPLNQSRERNVFKTAVEIRGTLGITPNPEVIANYSERSKEAVTRTQRQTRSTTITTSGDGRVEEGMSQKNWNEAVDNTWRMQRAGSRDENGNIQAPRVTVRRRI